MGETLRKILLDRWADAPVGENLLLTAPPAQDAPAGVPAAGIDAEDYQQPRASRLGAYLRQDTRVYVEVGPHVLDVVLLLECFEKIQHRAQTRLFQLDNALRDHR